MGSVTLVSGLSGAGKSHWIAEQQKEHGPFTVLDVADYYEMDHIGNSEQAWNALLVDLKQALPNEDIYVEGLLFENTPSYLRVINTLRRLGVEYRLIMIDTPWRICLDRIDLAYITEKDSPERAKARQAIVYAYGDEDTLRLQRNTANKVYSGLPTDSEQPLG